MNESDIRFLVLIVIAIASALKAYSWNKKRKIQSMVENMDNIDELKQLALATNTIGWVAGGKFGKDAEKYYFFAIKSLDTYDEILDKLPQYNNQNIKESAFAVYKILKAEMKTKFTKEELEYSQTWAALKILDVKNYMNGRSKEDIDDGAGYLWA